MTGQSALNLSPSRINNRSQLFHKKKALTRLGPLQRQELFHASVYCVVLSVLSARRAEYAASSQHQVDPLDRLARRQFVVRMRSKDPTRLTEIATRFIEHHAVEAKNLTSWSANGHSNHVRDRRARGVRATLREAGQRENCGGVSTRACAEHHTHGRRGAYPRTPRWIRSAQEMAVLHFGTGRVVARSGMLRTLPATSRRRRTNCLDVTVISLEILNFGREPKVLPYGYSAIGTRTTRR